MQTIDTTEAETTEAETRTEILTAREVAARLGLPIRRVYTLIASQYLPSVKVGRRAVRVPRAAFERWLSAQDPPAATPETGAALLARIGAGDAGRQLLALLEGSEQRQAAALGAFLTYFENAAPRRLDVAPRR